ncbi:MAG: terminase [Ruminococcus sp.]|nr:terminase [Ruminococcus sp.]
MSREISAVEYCRSCISDTEGKVGRYVKKQAQIWLDIYNGSSKDAFFSRKRAGRITTLLRLMIHPDLHCPMYDGLEPYAHFFVYAVLCTMRRDRKNIRYYETALLEICRKNFKTFNSAVVFIILMCLEPPFSRLFSVAPDYKLSSELRLAVRKIIKCSPALTKHFKITRDMITMKDLQTEYTPLAYSTDRMDGKLANAFLADEAGALDNYPVEAMRSSQITLLNSLGIIISTQYPNDNNVMIDEIDIAKKMLDGLNDQKGYFALLYEPDDELINLWETDDRVIYQSNPASVTNERIFEKLLQRRALARTYENKRENFLCKHCNIRYRSLGTEGFVEITKVRECRTDIPDSFWRGKVVYLGLDLSMSSDNTSVAMVCYHEGKIYAKVLGFIPEESIDVKTEKEKFDYNRAIRNGECIACGDLIIDYSVVERYALEIESRFDCTVFQLGYDRYNALSSVQKLEAADEPITCVEVKQHSSVLHPATKLLYEMIMTKNFAYSENLLLENNFANARCTYDTNLNRYVNKKRSDGKVDMVVSLIIAIYLLNVNEILSTGWAVQR